MSYYNQRYGYGGFGYDTSHVKSDCQHSEFYRVCEQGNLKKAKSMLAKETTIAKRLTTINGARRWTEIDYKASGFTKEYEWFDRTPVLIAIKKGHVSLVKYLLEEGANPALEACYADDCTTTAKKEAATSCAATEKDRQLIKDMVDVCLEYYPSRFDGNSCHYKERKFAMPKKMDEMLIKLRGLFDDTNLKHEEGEEISCEKEAVEEHHHDAECRLKKRRRKEKSEARAKGS